MAIIDPKQKENLPLLSEVMQIDFANEEEVQQFVNLKIGCNPQFIPEGIDWAILTNYHRRVTNSSHIKTLHGDNIALDYAPPYTILEEPELAEWAKNSDWLRATVGDFVSIRSRKYVQKLLQFTQQVTTEIFEKRGIEQRFKWTIEEWGQFVDSLYTPTEIPTSEDKSKLYNNLDINYPLLGADPDYLIPIESMGMRSENWGTGDNIQIVWFIRDLYKSLTSLYEEKQYKNLRRCIQCGNIFLSNPSKRGQNEPKYCSNTCGSIYRINKSRGKVSTK